MEDATGEDHEERFENERPADGEKDAGDLVLDQRAETETEETQQDGGGDEPGHHGPELTRDL